MKHLKPTSKHGTVMAVSMMKDEAPFLLEWGGVITLRSASPTSSSTPTTVSDGTDEMLMRREELGLGQPPAATRSGARGDQAAALGA